MSQRRTAGGKGQIIMELLYLGVTLGATAWFLKWTIRQLDPDRATKEKAKALKKAVQERLGIKILNTNVYEDAVAMEVINPAEIDTGMDDIGGCDRIKQELVNRVIMPLQKPQYYRSRLLQQVKGVLLYGPPGTGKTMLAKALAKESGAVFINIKPSMLQSKWFGDTQKLVQATFSLAYKLQPCIIFVDEVDALLGCRKAHEHEAVTALKTEFMQLWDGMVTRKNAQIMVLGATNRPFDLDDAVLRRFGAQYEVGMPDKKARRQILRLILQTHEAEMPGAVDRKLLKDLGPEMQLTKLAAMTENFSGSDLYELASEAASRPAWEMSMAEISAEQGNDDFQSADEEEQIAGSGRHRTAIAALSAASSSAANGVAAAAEPETDRQLSLEDFEVALKHFKPSGEHAGEYKKQQFDRGQVEPHQFLNTFGALMNAMGSGAMRGSNSGASGNSNNNGSDNNGRGNNSS